MNYKKVKTFLYLTLPFFISVFLSFILAGQISAQGASLFLSPLSGNYLIGSTFQVSVKVNAGGQLINAADGILVFDTNRLEVISVSKANSFFNLWVQEPTFSNSGGTISFAGGKSSPGYIGSSGHIFTIVFKAKTLGEANVSFSSGSVLADDGMGTNVLATLSSGTYTIQPTIIIPPPEEYIPPTKAPLAPVVFSPTHPDPEKWYSSNNPEFTWEISKDILGLRYLATRKPFSFPTYYSEPISETKLEGLADDIWYFHIRLRNKFGWGGISHFKFQIDTQPPAPFEIKIAEGAETTNPQPTLLFGTTDELSGVDYYEIRIDKEDAIIIKEEEYKLPLQDLGRHIIVIKAVDRAGNSMLAMSELNILSIEAPKITDYPKELIVGSPLFIKGTSIPEATIKLHFQKEREIETGETKSDQGGNWLYIHDRLLEKGTYDVWAEAIDKTGAKSEPSEKVVIFITPPAFIRIGKIVIDYLVILILLLILIIIIILLLVWLTRRIKLKKEKLGKETTEAERSLRQAFDTLRGETKRQVAKLDGEEGLSEREREVHDNLGRALKSSEEFIGKEIKDIEKELE